MATAYGPRFLMADESLSLEALFILLNKKHSIEYINNIVLTSECSGSEVFGTYDKSVIPATCKKEYQINSTW
jgi:hypothetical protein